MSIYENKDIEKILSSNTYGGRGIIIGKSPNTKKAIIAYFIMGRSENSRNRVFIERGEEVIINAFDPSKLEDPSLIIYSPIKKYKNNLIVTNGDQTDTIYDHLEKGKSFEEALRTREFEPDTPNFTPRISGILEFFKKTQGNACEEPCECDFSYKMSILKSADEKGSACNRYTFDYTSLPGLGHYIHTYNSDGNPIPTFTGEPERIAMMDSIDEFTEAIWKSLDEQNKVSLYVRYIDLETCEVENRLINKNK